MGEKMPVESLKLGMGHFVCAIYNGCNVVLSVGKLSRDSIVY